MLAEVVDLQPEPEGYRLVLAGGITHRVAGAVLAAGNLPPEDPGERPYVADPWTASFSDGLRAGEPVVVIGSGLTVVDMALRLQHAGFGGPAIAISRCGLRPQSHAATIPGPMPTFTAAERRSPARLLQRLRREMAEAAGTGVAWQSVVDSLRPITTELWRGLAPDGQEGSSAMRDPGGTCTATACRRP